MRAVPALGLALVMILAAPAVESGQITGRSSGNVVVNQWTLIDFWVNSTGLNTVVLSWTNPHVYDLEFTIYKPGVWDRKCPPNQNCVFQEENQDIYFQSAGCPSPLHNSEGMYNRNMTASRYHVVVKGFTGQNVPWTLTSTRGDLAFNWTLSAAQFYVPPC